MFALHSLPPTLLAETVRLVNATAATRQWSGRLELLYRGSWTPVCKSGFDIAAATVVCKQARKARALTPEALGRVGHPATPAAALLSGNFQVVGSCVISSPCL